jgi:hypothetical protein
MIARCCIIYTAMVILLSQYMRKVNHLLHCILIVSTEKVVKIVISTFNLIPSATQVMSIKTLYQVNLITTQQSNRFWIKLKPIKKQIGKALHFQTSLIPHSSKNVLPSNLETTLLLIVPPTLDENTVQMIHKKTRYEVLHHSFIK